MLTYLFSWRKASPEQIPSTKLSLIFKKFCSASFLSCFGVLDKSYPNPVLLAILRLRFLHSRWIRSSSVVSSFSIKMKKSLLPAVPPVEWSDTMFGWCESVCKNRASFARSIEASRTLVLSILVLTSFITYLRGLNGSAAFVDTSILSEESLLPSSVKALSPVPWVSMVLSEVYRSRILLSWPNPPLPITLPVFTSTRQWNRIVPKLDLILGIIKISFYIFLPAGFKPERRNDRLNIFESTCIRARLSWQRCIRITLPLLGAFIAVGGEANWTVFFSTSFMFLICVNTESCQNVLSRSVYDCNTSRFCLSESSPVSKMQNRYRDNKKSLYTSVPSRKIYDTNSCSICFLLV